MIKPLILVLARFAEGGLAVLAFVVMFAPYLGSVISNIGRRPVMLRPVSGRTARGRMQRAQQRSAAH
jgi:heme exporter protein D